MKELREITSFYNDRFAIFDKEWIEQKPSPELRMSIVIPSYDEPELDTTLLSLETCTSFPAGEVEVIVVLNHSENEDQVIVDKHQAQYRKWHGVCLTNGIPVFCIDAFALPKKKVGVGLARKTGMDESVKRFSKVGHDGLIVCLDADCEVSPDYITSLLKAEKEGWNGLSIYYEHDLDKVKDEAHLRHIINYEIFLRYYSCALQWAGYPYYFQTVGSSMASRASLYCKKGGMNSRKAGEDFYFLHKIFPAGSFKSWTDCTVFPSARYSNRVPFGTGKAMIRSKEDGMAYTKLYNPGIFEDLKELMQKIHLILKGDINSLPESVKQFAKQEKYEIAWSNLRERSNSKEQFHRNFLFWFDGFKVLKYIHFAQSFFPDIPNIEACRTLFDIDVQDARSLLLQLREREKRSGDKR